MRKWLAMTTAYVSGIIAGSFVPADWHTEGHFIGSWGVSILVLIAGYIILGD